MYPVNLQEFGYIVDDAKAAQELHRRLLDAVVAMVAKAAVSGDGVENCIFRDVIK